jgi:hypothetical protein
MKTSKTRVEKLEAATTNKKLQGMELLASLWQSLLDREPTLRAKVKEMRAADEAKETRHE